MLASMTPSDILSATVSFARIVADPNRLGEIFRLVDTITKHPFVSGPVVAAFRATEQGRAALRDRPRLGVIDLDALAALPAGTLGHEYAHHMRVNHLDPSALPNRSATTDAEYVSAHFYETHDIWHVVAGFGTDRASELGVQGLYLGQVPSRVAVAVLTTGFANTLLKEFDQYPIRLHVIVRGWLLGRRAQPLFGVDWKGLWTTPLEDVRRRFEVDVDGVDRLLASWRSAGPPDPTATRT
jgi:ubiquinone biosynthesis protein Coq4